LYAINAILVHALPTLEEVMGKREAEFAAELEKEDAPGEEVGE
jgi:hypothetical protein